MNIILTRMSPKEVKGTYTVKGVPNQMPTSALFLHPDAARSWRENEFSDIMVVSDMLRTAESSLQAVQSGRGARLPGYSNHGFGKAIDSAVTMVMKILGFKTKAELDAWMEKRGWYCHRRDHKRDKEEWHYNYLGVGVVISPKVDSTAGYAEQEILRMYGGDFKFDAITAQRYLKKLGLYGGDLDGMFGPRSKSALTAFQRTWTLDETAKLDIKTMRTLAFVSADVTLV